MNLKKTIHLFLMAGLLFFACNNRSQMPEVNPNFPERHPDAMTGSEFMAMALTTDPETRETWIAREILSGNFPPFMRDLSRIDVETTDPQGNLIRGYYFVMPDYLSVGSDEDFVRMPMQPKTAQRIADRFGFFLSTKKIADDVYRAAVVKLEPRPLTENRDSLATFYEHHKIIEEQRQGAGGLIAGIKKDIVITPALLQHENNDRVALYGWHKLDGERIQPVYTGHIDWYVDYSHGIRLVYRTIFVEGKSMDYTEVLSNPVLSRLICDEEGGIYYAYPY